MKSLYKRAHFSLIFLMHLHNVIDHSDREVGMPRRSDSPLETKSVGPATDARALYSTNLKQHIYISF